jgi:dolichol-phosphate mannosyltransferase
LKSVVVIPTYNEAENLPKMVSALFTLPLDDLHLLIVDDASPDGTGKIADELKASNPRIDVMHRQGKLGLGSAYISGFQKALANGADLICQMDCDFSHDPLILPVLFKWASDGADVVVGSRYAPGGKLDETWPFWRRALSWFGNYYARTILGLKVRDVTAGFKVWRREILAKMPLNSIKSNGYVFQVEMIYAATRLGANVQEVPIYFADRKFGKSKMSFKIQLEAAIRVWKLPGIHRHLSVEKRSS